MCTRESRDPRFDSLSGTLDNDRFRMRYAFLYDEQLPAEREQIKSSLQVASPLRPGHLCLTCTPCAASGASSLVTSRA